MNWPALLLLAAVLPTAACTHQVLASGTNMPAGEVMANRIIQTPTVYSMSPDLQDTNPAVGFDSMACSAHTYNLALGPAIEQTLTAATQAGFAHATLGQPTTLSGYNVRFGIDDASGHLNLIPGFFSSKINAHVEIDGRVDVTDAQGTEVARAVLDGEATEVLDGGCFNADGALKAAADKAIRRLGTDYVYKIINTNVLH